MSYICHDEEKEINDMTTNITHITWITICLGTAMLFANQLWAQESQGAMQAPNSLHSDYDKIAPLFEEAYRLYPTIPKGILEAISYQYRRFSLMEPALEENGIHSIPANHTLMGLTAEGKGVFRENLLLVERLSSFTKEKILSDPRIAVLAYAEAFASLQREYDCYGEDLSSYKPILIALSELPYHEPPASWEENYPLNSSLYETYRFLSDSSNFCFTHHVWQVDFEKIFGSELNRLRQNRLDFSVKDMQETNTSDYGSANWLPAAGCNYTQGRNGATITGVTIHYTQGTYAGTLAWFQNCNANASAHYVIRSSDGQITQMVHESDKAWHVGTANGYTIGIEHEAYGNIYSYFTEAMYQASAGLVRDICQRRPNINPRHTFYRDTLDDGTALNSGLHSLGGASACTQIRGHQHYPNQTHTDPGPYWDWNHYYHLINSQTTTIIDTSASGIFYDSGGATGPYAANEHQYFLLKRTNADSIALEFTNFDLETNYDFLWIYDGESPQAPLLGRWNSLSPGRVVSSGPALLVEFRSDCATENDGWCAHWTCYNAPLATPDTAPPTTHIMHDASIWITHDFTLSFDDWDDTHIPYRFWQIMERNAYGWQANPAHGFLCDNFDNNLSSSVWCHDGSWIVSGNKLTCTDSPNGEHRIFAHHHDEVSDCFLYDFYLNMKNGDSCSFHFHTETNAQKQPIRGYEIRFLRNQRTIALYRIHNGLPILESSVGSIYISGNTTYRYRILWDTTSHRILFYRHQNLLMDCTVSPVTSGGTDHFIGFSCDNPVQIDNLRIYAGRGETVSVSVGSADSCLLQAQARLGAANSKVKSIVVDSQLQFSELAECTLKVDYTPPPVPTIVSSGIDSYPGLRLNAISLFCHWNPVTDEESGMAGYEYTLYVVTTHNTCPITSWTSTTSTSIQPGTKVPWQSNSCRIVVKSVDKAGNKSAGAMSNELLDP